MRRSSEVLSDIAVARIDQRRKDLNLTCARFLLLFTAALQREHACHSANSAKMRLDRVLNPKMRRPISDTTKAALASALRWTLHEFEQEVMQDRPVHLLFPPSILATSPIAARAQLERLANAFSDQAHALRQLANSLS